MKFEFDPTELRPLIEAVVAETLANIQGGTPANGHSNGRLAFTERDAAQQLGLPQHSLRDARKRGEISAVKTGSRWLYSRAELERFAREGAGNS